MKQDWQGRLRSIKFGRKGFEDTEKVENSAMSVPFYDENLYLLNMKNDLEAKVAFYMLKFCVYVYCFTHEVEPASYGSCL